MDDGLSSYLTAVFLTNADASTLLFSNTDLPPQSLEDDWCASFAQLCHSADIRSTMQIVRSRSSAILSNYRHLTKNFYKLSASFLSNIHRSGVGQIYAASVIEEMVAFVDIIRTECLGQTLGTASDHTFSSQKKASLDDIPRIAKWILRDLPHCAMVSELVAKCVLLCAEGSSLYPSRIMVRGERCDLPCIVPGMVLERAHSLTMRYLNLKVPCTVLLLSFSVTDDELSTILGLVLRLNVKVLTSQKVICEAVQRLLVECGVVCIDRLSIHSLQNFSLTVGAFPFDTLASALAATPDQLGHISSITALGGAFGGIHIQGAHTKTFTFVVPLQECLGHAAICHAESIRSCIALCARLFSNPHCVNGDGSFECALVGILRNTKKWELISKLLDSAVRNTFGFVDDGKIRTDDEINLGCIEPSSGRFALFCESLALVSVLLRVHSVESAADRVSID